MIRQGDDLDRPELLAAADGFVDVSVTMYPVTPTLSVAVNDVIGTVNDVDVDGMSNDVTVGSSVSGSVIVVVSLRLSDTFPAPSFAHAYSVLLPSVPNV